MKNLVNDLGVTAGGRFGLVLELPSCLCVTRGVGRFSAVTSPDDIGSGSISGLPDVVAMPQRLNEVE